jgi:DNA-binding transcriptional ArsR family regulator
MMIFNHMVKYQSSELDMTFGALADATRRGILEQLSGGESSVTKLAEPYNISLPAISKHLRVLERAGLLSQEKNGRVRRCRLDAGPMKEASDWISRYQRFWEQQLDSLAIYLDKLQNDQNPEEDGTK